MIPKQILLQKLIISELKELLDNESFWTKIVKNLFSSKLYSLLNTAQ